MNDTPPPAPSRRPARWLLPLAVVVVLGAAGYAGWHYWQQQQRDRAAISVYAQGKDYHDLVKRRLKRLGRWLLEDQQGGEIKVFVDTAPVMEKPLAQAAGLGWQGKHTNMVSPTHGSWLFLGAIYTTLRFAPDAITQEVLELVAARFPDHFGDLEPFGWAVTREGALQALDHFITDCLPTFGDYQDAMKSGEDFLYHSLISPYLNCGLLTAREVCSRAEAVHHAIGAHLAPATAALFGGLEDEVHRAVKVLVLGQMLRSCQEHGHMAVVSAGVHLAGMCAGVGKGVELLHGQGVHVGAQSQCAAGGAGFHNAHHPGSAHAAVDRNAPLGQLGGHHIGRAHLLKTQLRVGMDVFAQGRNFGGVGNNGFDQFHGKCPPRGQKCPVCVIARAYAIR